MRAVDNADRLWTMIVGKALNPLWSVVDGRHILGIFQPTRVQLGERISLKLPRALAAREVGDVMRLHLHFSLLGLSGIRTRQPLCI